MPGAPKTVYVHIGLHKTGTTYLQNVLRANRERLRAQQIDFPGGPDEPVQSFAVWDLQGRRPRGVGDERISGSWDRLVQAVNTGGYPIALISEERLSLSTGKQVKKVVASFPESEVHVIVTARDLGRVAVSAWQEEIKNDQTWTWQEFVTAIRDPAQGAKSPARGFWMRQDLVKVCATWEAGVPPERLHVITVPPSGSSPEELLNRFSAVVGIEPAALTEAPAWNNETVGVAATEVIRRINERLGGRLHQRQHDKVIKMTVVQMLAKRTEPVRFTLPAEELPWIKARADEMVAELRARGYQVVGDLDELQPSSREGGRRPDDATDPELLEASLDALALLAEKYATSWWSRRRRPDQSPMARGGVASATRALVFKGQRRAAKLADSNAGAARAMGVVLKIRDRARLRDRDKLK